MCERFSTHKDADMISGKMWLIGRSYAVAIERVRNKKLINDDFYEKSVPSIFLRHYTAGDQDLTLLKNREISFQNISDALKVHARLTDAIMQITELGKRSLSSKYLHFHARNSFFIYDSRAKIALSALIAGMELKKRVVEESKKLSKNLICDREYKEFCVRNLILRDELYKRFKVNLSTRQMDNLLIEVANKKLRLTNSDVT